MSNKLWNEASLLDRYQVFKYIYFIDIRRILLNHLEKLYDFYKTDLRSEFISHSFSQEIVKKQDIQNIKANLLNSLFFRYHISQMMEIALRNHQGDPYRVPLFVLEERRCLQEEIQIENYTALFTEISDHAFRYFLKMHVSTSTLDKMICSFKIENSLNIHYLPCLVAAHFQLILHQSH